MPKSGSKSYWPQRLLGVAGGLLLVGAFAGVAIADARQDRVVATIGQGTLTVGEIERVLRLMPTFRLANLGPTPDAIRRTFVEELIDFELLAVAAKSDHLDEREDVQSRVRGVLVQALQSRLRAEALASVSVSDEAVKAYYEQNAERYRSELRLKLWHIVVDKREDAAKLIETIKTDKEFAKDPIVGWEKLVEKHSTDKTTHLKNGNLGFVRADGSTKDKQIRVNPALYAAALKVKDGEIAPEPIADGATWAIVQRRGTVDTPERTLEAETPNIRAMLGKQVVGKKLEAMLAELRKRYVTEIYEQRIDDVEIDVQGNLSAQPRQGSLPQRRGAERAGPPVGDPHEHR